ncbi:hypothetical protein MLD38_022584 [Melastoma candidum]|uniref:Uncharacterized protein n=1 Tax=Melastoma candidum TaxID=119954 RepID=A0ACB9QJR3_9MYRT|nr:hypothetical protein MLD38_022584 [Melastoma candidum]
MEAAVQFPVARSAGYSVPDWRDDPRTGKARAKMTQIILKRLPLIRYLETADEVEFAATVEKELYYQSNSLRDYINTETLIDRISITTQKWFEIYCAVAMAKNNGRHAVPSHLSGSPFGTCSFLPQQTWARNPGAASVKSYRQDRSYSFFNREQHSLATNPAAYLVSPACFLSGSTASSDPPYPVSLVGSSNGNATFCNPALSPHCGSVFGAWAPPNDRQASHGPLYNNNLVGGQYSRVRHGNNITHHGPTFGIHSSESAARQPYSTEQPAAVPARQYMRGLSGEHIVQDRDANPTSEAILSDENPVSHAGASHGNRSGFSNGHGPVVGTVNNGGFSLEDGKEAPDGLSSRNGPLLSEGAVPWPIHSAEQFPEDLQEVVNNIPNCEPVWDDLPDLVPSIVGTSEVSDLLKWNEWANESLPRLQHSSESLLPDVPVLGESAVINLTDNDEPQLNLEVGPAHVQEIHSFGTVDDSKSDPSREEPLNCHELKATAEVQLMDEVATGTEIPTEDEITRVQLLQSEETQEDEILEKVGCKSSETESSDQCYVSMTEFMSEEQILEHLSSLGNSIRTGSGDEATASFSENICRLCGEEKLFYEVVPCSYCGANIKKSGVYYSLSDAEGGLTLCKQCYNHCGKKIYCGEKSYSKEKLRRMSTKQGTEEDWVQCDKCQGWQHQICTLYNQVADNGGNAKYTCPLCCLKEIKSGNRLPSEVGVQSACNLPRTALSDHIEQRLQTSLREDRELRAKGSGKGFLEVPSAEDLTVRVVHTGKRKLKVKDEFLDLFKPNDYPSQFPYTSKMILLFQKIGGVDVILFGFYAEEYGSDCGDPNSRCIYISYLDSIKYFRPSVSSATGDALRTFAYHEILIGYLEYCKKRGFVSCHLWSCPPQKGQDYLFYNHPEDQRTLTAPKLRNWYQTMIQKAIKEKVVVCSSNVYDCHFRASCGSRYPVSATRLPFFEGDSWFNFAANVLKEVNEESKSDYQRKRVKTGKHKAKAVQCTDSLYDSKDFLFMQKLGRILQQGKKDFIVMHLRHVCSHCNHPISSGQGWFCDGCTDFWLCERCHDEENSVADSHWSNKGKRHSFSKVAVDILPSSTDDNDGPIENLMLRNRHRFLMFCQKKHYQFDTLRRAKHSSMMVLHFLSRPDNLSECSICANISLSEDFSTWETCPDLQVCPQCQVQRSSSRGHPVTCADF